jgi:hypothetical protein
MPSQSDTPDGDHLYVFSIPDGEHLDDATVTRIKEAMNRQIPPDEYLQRVLRARAAYWALGASKEQLDASYPIPE